MKQYIDEFVQGMDFTAGYIRKVSELSLVAARNLMPLSRYEEMTKPAGESFVSEFESNSPVYRAGMIAGLTQTGKVSTDYSAEERSLLKDYNRQLNAERWVLVKDQAKDIVAELLEISGEKLYDLADRLR